MKHMVIAWGGREKGEDRGRGGREKGEDRGRRQREGREGEGRRQREGREGEGRRQREGREGGRRKKTEGGEGGRREKTEGGEGGRHGSKDHTLTVTGRLGGLYTCVVANDKPSCWFKLVTAVPRTQCVKVSSRAHAASH